MDQPIVICVKVRYVIWVEWFFKNCYLLGLVSSGQLGKAKVRVYAWKKAGTGVLRRGLWRPLERRGKSCHQDLQTRFVPTYLGISRGKVWVDPSKCGFWALAEDLNRSDMEKEINALKSLCHRNLIRLLAVCSIGEPVYIVTELMTKGNLQDYLKGQPLSQNMISMIWKLQKEGIQKQGAYEIKHNPPLK